MYIFNNYADNSKYLLEEDRENVTYYIIRIISFNMTKTLAIILLRIILIFRNTGFKLNIFLHIRSFKLCKYIEMIVIISL